MKESDSSTSSYLSVGSVVNWKCIYYRNFTEAFRTGFPMLGGYFSVGFNNKGNPVQAIRLYPENKDEHNLFKKRDTKKIRGIWNDQIKKSKVTEPTKTKVK